MEWTRTAGLAGRAEMAGTAGTGDKVEMADTADADGSLPHGGDARGGNRADLSRTSTLLLVCPATICDTDASVGWCSRSCCSLSSTNFRRSNSILIFQNTEPRAKRTRMAGTTDSGDTVDTGDTADREDKAETAHTAAPHRNHSGNDRHHHDRNSLRGGGGGGRRNRSDDDDDAHDNRNHRGARDRDGHDNDDDAGSCQAPVIWECSSRPRSPD